MNLLLRVLSAAILLLLLAGALWAGSPWVAVVLGAATLVSAWEFAGLAGRAGFAPTLWVLYPLSLWLAIRFALPSAYRTSEWPLLAAATAGVLGAALSERRLTGWAAAVAGSIYTGFSLGFFLAVFQWHGATADHFGLRLVALPLLAVVAGDTIAYLVGSAVGRHPFFRSISPKKTREGAAAGAIATILVAALIGPPLVGMPVLLAAGLGALLTLSAQGGDLVESALKRQAGVKDSSRLIPGHGGMLDRVDSLLVVGPAVYCYLRLIAFP